MPEIEIRDEFIAHVTSHTTHNAWRGGVHNTYEAAHAEGVEAANAMVTLGATRVDVTIDKRTLVVTVDPTGGES